MDSWQLRGPFDAEPFARRCAGWSHRHPVLRTSFDLTGYSEPLQLVHRDVRIDLGVADLRALDEAAQETAVGRLRP